MGDLIGDLLIYSSINDPKDWKLEQKPLVYVAWDEEMPVEPWLKRD